MGWAREGGFRPLIPLGPVSSCQLYNSKLLLRFLTSLRGHVAAVYQIAWSADSRLLVSGSSDSTLKVWDTKTQKLAVDLPGHADEVRGAAVRLGKLPHLAITGTAHPLGLAN